MCHYSARLPHFLAAALVGIGVSLTLSAAQANDGGIALGGSPGLLKDHPSVSMTREVIRITVDGDTVTADCRFVFTNHGPACTVRMGFPDEGTGAFDPDEEQDPNKVMGAPPRTTFRSFRSWVDGHEVTTKLIRASEQGKYWHTKNVRFAAHSVHQVHDVYTQPVGGGIAASPTRTGWSRQVGYILHTGASWHGPIGHTAVVVTFHDPKMPRRLKAIAVTLLSRSGDGRDLSTPIPYKDAVVWKGPCKPSVSGRTLRFVRDNWRPTRADDIELTFANRETKIPAGRSHTRSLRTDRSEDKYHALCLAARRGDLLAVKRLLGSGARVNGPTGEVTPLMLAAEHSHPAIIRYLLSKGAQVEAAARPGSLTGLLYAHDLLCVKALIQGGANVNAADVDGETALMRWLERPDREAEQVIRLLIAKGADVHCGAEAGETGLMRAVEAGNVAVVRLLLEKGAPVNETADSGETALAIAKRKHRSDLTALLTK